jgi:hypothetical protein
LTYSTWVKRSVLSTYQHFGLTAAVSGSSRDAMRFDQDSQDVIQVYFDEGGTYNVRTSAVFRDPSAWYNIVIAIDTTLSTTSQRVRIYVNNVEQTLTGTQPIQNYQFLGFLVSGKAQNIGRHPSAAFYFNGYLSDVYCIDGQQLTPSSFGETDPQTGVWIPKVYTGSYGTNGFRLRFNNNSSTTALGYDTSGNGNNWTPNNFSVTAGSGNDSMLDVPSLYGTDTGLGGEVRGNYATWNPLETITTSKPTNGNLDYAPSSTSPQVAFSSIAIPSTGKWYAEITKGDANTSWPVGIQGPTRSGITYASQTEGIAYWAGGQIYKDSALIRSGLVTATTNDVIGIAVDSDAKTVLFYKNGVVITTAISYTYSQVWFACGNYVSGLLFYANFGQRPFAYTAPSGFKALCTTNLSASGTVTTSGTFTGNASTDGPFIYLNGIPTAMTINGNAVTFGTQADKLSNGFKVRSSSSSYNTSGSNTYSVSTTGAIFRYSNAQGNP